LLKAQLRQTSKKSGVCFKIQQTEYFSFPVRLASSLTFRLHSVLETAP